MKKIITTFLLVFILMGVTEFTNAQLVISNATPSQLGFWLVGGGVYMSNVAGQISNLSAGKFRNYGVSGFPLDSGVVLSTGKLDSLNGANLFQNSTDLGMPGNGAIDSLTGQQNSYDAQVLEFDFSAANDSIRFQFVFASEEYNEFSNIALSDKIAILISGPGYTQNTNLAIIPGTSIPISINSINNGYSTGTSSGPCVNCNYFVENVNTGNVNLNYDGFTVPIEIKAHVLPCDDYHLKIVIADVSDEFYDSAIFLKQGSFKTFSGMPILNNGVPVGDTVTICFGGSIMLTSPYGPNLSWVTGDTTQSIYVSQPGLYNYALFGPGMCFAFSNTITVLQAGSIQTPIIVQNGTVFSAPNIIPNPNITYQWSLNGVNIPVADQPTYNFTSNGCYRLTIYEGACESVSNEICISVSLNELSESIIRVYPHPILNTSILETPFISGTVTKLNWFDITGRLIRSESNNGGSSVLLEKNELPAGVYTLEISNSGYTGRMMKKIILQ